MAEQVIQGEDQEGHCSEQLQAKGSMDAWTREVREEAESDKKASSPVTQLSTLPGIGSEISFPQSELRLMDTH